MVGDAAETGAGGERNSADSLHRQAARRRSSIELKKQLDAGTIVRTQTGHIQPVSLRPDLMVFQEKGLCGMSKQFPIRKACIKMARHPWFDKVIVLLIVVNCALLGMQDPLDKENVSWRNRAVSETEIYFTVAFTGELTVKIIAAGAFGKNSYFSDRWNWLDFVVVATGWISQHPAVANLNALRTFRVLRPLRTLTSIPGMRVIVHSMLASIPALFNVFLLCAFIFFIFGIIGVQLWAGVLDRRCAYQENGTWVKAEPDMFCSLPCAEGDPACSPTFGDDCGSVRLSRYNESTGVWDGVFMPTTCREYGGTEADPVAFGSPNHGLTSFNNIGLACLTIFTSITLEGWVDVMYALNHSWGVAPFNAAYFVLLIMFGSFFLVNLALAVIWDEYVKAEEQEKQKAEELERIAAEELAVEQAAEEKLAAPDDGPDGGAGGPIVPPRGAGDIEQGGVEGDDGDDGVKHGCIYNLVESQWFNAMVVVLILANTLCLALDHYDMPASLATFLNVMNYVFTAMFFVEMVLKLIGLGFRGYSASTFNIFDGVIVLISLIELGIEFAGLDQSSGLGALRTLRLMRVFKLARSWEDLRKLLTTIMKSVADVANASIVLLIVMFIFCLLGMTLFGGVFTEEVFPEELPRAHFDNIWWSFVTVFQVLTGENWNEVLYDTVHAAGGIGIAYFVLLNLVGNYLILNLFLAILLGNFDSAAEEEAEQLEEAKSKKPAIEPAKTAAVAPMRDDEPIPSSPLSEGRSQPERRSDKYAVDDQKAAQTEAPAGDNSVRKIAKGAAGADAGAGIGIGSSGKAAWQDADSSDTAPAATESQPKTMKQEPDADGSGTKEGSTKQYSLYLFHPENPIRVFCARVKSHRYFEAVILTLIAVSSIMLAIDEPHIGKCKGLSRDDPENCVVFANFLSGADLVITILFTFEMVIKIIAMGFAIGEGAYLSISWNRLDFAIVIVSYLSIGLQGQEQLKALRSLRALRALRPLRVVSRYPQLKLVVNSIFGSLPKVRNVLLVNILFFVIFAIVGVQNWAGKLNSCNDGEIATKAECVGNFTVRPQDGNCHFLPTSELITECELDGAGRNFTRVWGPPPFHFDNTGNAVLTVFEVASGEMWPDIMYVTVDAVGVDEPLVTDNSPLAALYFIMINVVCAFFMLEIFTGVVIDNFNKMKEESQGGGVLLTEKQQVWVDTMKMMLGTVPQRRMRKPPAKQKFRNRLFKIASSKRFELFIMALIFVNSVVLALRHSTQSEGFAKAVDVTNLLFAGAFLLEAILKITAFGARQYFSAGWNRFDFTLVVASVVGFVFDLGQIATLLRIVRVARIFRLVRTSKGLLTLFKTLLFSFPSLVNVGTVLLLVYFIYAVVAMNLFANIKDAEFINEDANFRRFFITMLTLFRMSTGESYNGIMHDCMVQEPYCIKGQNCGIPWFAPLYFISFFVLTAFILLNLLVAIILDNFNDAVSMDEGRSEQFRLTDRDMEAFQAVWSKYDPAATRYIPVANMVNVLLELPKPLGLAGEGAVVPTIKLRKSARNLLVEMRIPEHDSRVHFHQALQALAKHAVGAVTLPVEVPIVQDLEKQQNRLLRKVGESRRGIASTFRTAMKSPAATDKRPAAKKQPSVLATVEAAKATQ